STEGATKQMARCRPAPEGWGALGLLALLLLSHRAFGYASSSRLARSPNRLQQMAKIFFCGPLHFAQGSGDGKAGRADGREETSNEANQTGIDNPLNQK